MIPTNGSLHFPTPLLRAIGFACFFLLLGFTGGCGSTSGEKQQTAEQTPQDEEQVSTIPWNKPEKWERKGAIGSGGVGY